MGASCRCRTFGLGDIRCVSVESIAPEHLLGAVRLWPLGEEGGGHFSLIPIASGDCFFGISIELLDLAASNGSHCSAKDSKSHFA